LNQKNFYFSKQVLVFIAIFLFQTRYFGDELSDKLLIAALETTWY